MIPPMAQGASAWYPGGAAAASCMNPQFPEITAATPTGWQQPPAAFGEMLPMPQAVGPCMDMLGGAVLPLPVHAAAVEGMDAYPQMDFGTAAPQAGWAGAQSVDAALAAAAAAGWDVAGMNWTATQQASYMSVESDTAGGDLLWGAALAAAANSAQRMPSGEALTLFCSTFQVWVAQGTIVCGAGL